MQEMLNSLKAIEFHSIQLGEFKRIDFSLLQTASITVPDGLPKLKFSNDSLWGVCCVATTPSTPVTK